MSSLKGGILIGLILPLANSTIPTEHLVGNMTSTHATDEESAKADKQLQTTQYESYVDFDGATDPAHPVNWTYRKKIMTTFLYSLTTMSTPFASAMLVNFRESRCRLI